MSGDGGGGRRRLVLNGLTAECGAVLSETSSPAVAVAAAESGDEHQDYYHELELYRQLLALDDTALLPHLNITKPEPKREPIPTISDLGERE